MSTLHDTVKELKMRIIEQVRDRPVLYDSAHPRSKDTAFKDETYEAIGAQVGCPGSDVKFLFNSLRKEYSNQRSMYESKLEKGGPDTVPEPTWTFWKRMNFLRDKMQKRRRVPRSRSRSMTENSGSYIVQPSNPGPSAVLVPLLPKPTPTQYIQVPGGTSSTEEKSSKEYGIDVSKYLVIQTANVENTSMSEQRSISPSGNGFDTSQSSDEDTEWQHSSTVQVDKDPLEQRMNSESELPRKKIKLEESEMIELADAIRSMSSALATNAVKMSDVCQHPDICSLGRYVTSQIQLFPKNVQLDLEAEILRVIMAKKKAFFNNNEQKNDEHVNTS